jgi:sec-independent protein translocase protein TatB
MPDIGLFELILIGVLLFVVVGPERMPEFLGQIGRWVRSGRGWISEVRSELSRETAAITAPLNDAKAHVEEGLDSIHVTAREIGDAVRMPDDASPDAPDDKPKAS